MAPRYGKIMLPPLGEPPRVQRLLGLVFGVVVIIVLLLIAAQVIVAINDRGTGSQTYPFVGNVVFPAGN